MVWDVMDPSAFCSCYSFAHVVAFCAANVNESSMSLAPALLKSWPDFLYWFLLYSDFILWSGFVSQHTSFKSICPLFLIPLLFGLLCTMLWLCVLYDLMFNCPSVSQECKPLKGRSVCLFHYLLYFNSQMKTQHMDNDLQILNLLKSVLNISLIPTVTLITLLRRWGCGFSRTLPLAVSSSKNTAETQTQSLR